MLKNQSYKLIAYSSFKIVWQRKDKITSVRLHINDVKRKCIVLLQDLHKQ
jgi:hypothetical protein